VRALALGRLRRLEQRGLPLGLRFWFWFGFRIGRLVLGKRLLAYRQGRLPLLGWRLCGREERSGRLGGWRRYGTLDSRYGWRRELVGDVSRRLRRLRNGPRRSERRRRWRTGRDLRGRVCRLECLVFHLRLEGRRLRWSRALTPEHGVDGAAEQVAPGRCRSFDVVGGGRRDTTRLVPRLDT
jgi:hypothetical protein